MFTSSPACVVRGLPVLAGLLSVLLAFPSARAAVPCAGEVSGAGDALFHYYTPGSGACLFNGDDSAPLVAAMNSVDFAGSAMCGRWVRVTGPLGTVTVRIVDESPDLAPGEIDLNAAAFAAIAELWMGRVACTWETVASPVDETVSIVTNPGTNPWWVSVHVRHHRYGIAALEYLGSAGYVAVPRTGWNAFQSADAPGIPVPLASPFSVRVTDVHGQQLEITGLNTSGDQEFDSGQQFPVCQDFTSGAPLPAAAGAVLLPPSPNPFNPRTTVAFELPARGPATLRVFDAAGRAVATLLEARVLEAGRHALAWDGRNDTGRPAPGGLYLLRLEAAGGVQVRKAALLK